VATVAISIRAEETLAARVDTFAEQVMAERPGLKVSRTEAIVMLLTESLDAKGIKPKATTAKRAAAPAKKGAKRARKP
jgi:hypothetical protein